MGDNIEDIFSTRLITLEQKITDMREKRDTIQSLIASYTANKPDVQSFLDKWTKLFKNNVYNAKGQNDTIVARNIYLKSRITTTLIGIVIITIIINFLIFR